MKITSKKLLLLYVFTLVSLTCVSQKKNDKDNASVKDVEHSKKVEFSPIVPDIYNGDFSLGTEGWSMANFTGGNSNPFNKSSDGSFTNYDGTDNGQKTPGAKWNPTTSVVIAKDGSVKRTKNSRFAYQDIVVSPNMEYYLEYSYAFKKSQDGVKPLGEQKIFGEILSGHFDDGKDAFKASITNPLVKSIGSEVKGKKIHTVVKVKFTAPDSGKISTWFYASTPVDVYIDNVKIYPVHSVVMIDAPKVDPKKDKKSKKKKKKRKKRKKVKLPNIDLSHWKVTIPAGNKNKPITVGSPAIFKYATDKRLKPYMYNDSVRGALVFHAFPSKATTRNTKYSRSELREQMVPGDDDVNWKFSDGAYLKAKIAIDDVTLAKKGKYKYSRIIILQIHGRLSDAQRDLIGEDDNNAPPMLKIYWEDGKIKVATKELKYIGATVPEILHEDAWGNRSEKFEQKVNFKKFELEVKISKGKMVIVLNGNEFLTYKDIHMEKWDVFENYFKAGNYFQSREKGTYGKVRFYELEVKH